MNSLRSSAFDRRQLRDQTQGNRQSLELKMGPQVKLGRVVTWVSRNLLDSHAGIGQGKLRFDLLAGLRVGGDIIHDPLVQPALHILALLEGADFVAHNALEEVGELARREEIRESRSKVCVGRRIRIVVFLRLLKRLRADENNDNRSIGLRLARGNRTSAFHPRSKLPRLILAEWANWSGDEVRQSKPTGLPYICQPVGSNHASDRKAIRASSASTGPKCYF